MIALRREPFDFGILPASFLLPRAESVAALADCVKRFEGAVVVVSHDQYFVNEVANEAWVVNKGAVRRAKSFADYVKKQVKKLDDLA